MYKICFFLCLLLLPACTNTLRHEIVIDLNLDDECLFAFPECSLALGYYCANADGVVRRDCQVACIAARTLACEPDGPYCTQTIGDEDLAVPVVCVSR